MNKILRLVLFLSFFFGVAVAGYKVYRRLNERIVSSHSGWQLLGFSLLLIAVNVLLFFGGLFLFLKLYEYLLSEE